MNCERVTREEIADKYVSGQLDSALRDEFEIHILECRNCLELVEAYEALRSELVASSAGPGCTPNQPLPEWAKQAPVAIYEDRLWGSGSGVRIGNYMGDEGWYEKGSTPPIPLGPAKRSSPFRLAWVPVTALVMGVLVLTFGHLSRRSGRVRPAIEKTPPMAQREASPTGVSPAGTADVASGTKAPMPQQQQERTKTGDRFDVAPTRQESVANNTGAPQQSRPPETAPEVSLPRVTEQKAVVTADATRQKPATPPLTQHDVATELFRLGMVDPPVYALAGFRGNTTGPAAAGQGYSGIGVADGRTNFQEAMLAYVDGRYESAASLLEDARRTEPHAPEINFYLGICRLMRGSSAEAIEALTAATARRSPLLQSAHFYLAKAYIQTGNLAEAENQLQAAIAARGRLSTEAKSLLARLRAVRSKMYGETKAAPEILP